MKVKTVIWKPFRNGYQKDFWAVKFKGLQYPTQVFGTWMEAVRYVAKTARLRKIFRGGAM